LNTPGSPEQALVSDIGERGLIEAVRARVPPPPPQLLIGIGDDAAVFRPERGALQVLTTDAFVEGVHFDRRFSSASDIGYKALAVNVSDVAAMGGTPTLALLSLMLPESTPLADVDGILDGLLDMAQAVGVALAGGNITRSPGPLIVDVTLAGAVRPRRVLTRSGGRPGDAVYVSGTVGAGAAGLGWLKTHASDVTAAPDDRDLAECVRRYRRPEPRTRLGALLGRTRTATACMDLRDGLADAVRQVAAASGTGAAIDGSLLPVGQGARQWFETHHADPLMAILAGGDDYELLFTVPARLRGRLRGVARQARGVPFTRIGELTADGSLCVVTSGGPRALPPGFSHF
jgi:thiamine-monophosphate kinase